MGSEWDEESRQICHLTYEVTVLGHRSSQSESDVTRDRMDKIVQEVVGMRLFKGHVFCDGRYIKDTDVCPLGYALWQRRQLFPAGFAVVYRELDAVEKAKWIHNQYEQARSVRRQWENAGTTHVRKISVVTAAVDVTRPIRDFADYFLVSYPNDCFRSPCEDIRYALHGLGYPDHAVCIASVEEDMTAAVYRDAARTRDELVAQVKARFRPYEEERIETGSHRKH